MHSSQGRGLARATAGIKPIHKYVPVSLLMSAVVVMAMLPFARGFRTPMPFLTATTGSRTRVGSCPPHFAGVAENIANINPRRRCIASQWRVRLSSSETDGEDVLNQDVVSGLFGDDPTDRQDIADCTPGSTDGFRVVQQYVVPLDGFDLSTSPLEKIELVRLDVSSTNVTLPVALTMLDPAEYPSLSRARKACRKGTIVLRRASDPPEPPLSPAAATPSSSSSSSSLSSQTEINVEGFARSGFFKGRVADRVHPNDVVGKQMRVDLGAYSSLVGHAPPPFDLRVVYEDQHMAIVNKPAGVVVHDMYDDQQRNAAEKNKKENKKKKIGHGRNTIRHALPYVLTPPPLPNNTSTSDDDGAVPLPRPATCHRLDKQTSGLLVVAKTRGAVRDLTRQFEERVVRKTYSAIVNGVPLENAATAISDEEARRLGVDVDVSWATQAESGGSQEGENQRGEAGGSWQVLHDLQDGKEAVTMWRTLRHVRSATAADKTLTLMELKPKTGRFHQLRRHVAWACGTPIVGDATYGAAADAKRFGRGLMLCSNRISLQHPHYNTPDGRMEWDKKRQDRESLKMQGSKGGGGSGLLKGDMLYEGADGVVYVEVSIDLPNKFHTFMATQDSRAANVQVT